MKRFILLAAIFVPISALYFFGMYGNYEGGNKTGRMISGEVLWYGRDAGGLGRNGFYHIKLENGLRVNVQSFGELSIKYKGPVMLDVLEGEATSRPVYRINVAKSNAQYGLNISQ